LAGLAGKVRQRSLAETLLYLAPSLQQLLPSGAEPADEEFNKLEGFGSDDAVRVG
jgi:hypothetical protein